MHRAAIEHTLFLMYKPDGFVDGLLGDVDGQNACPDAVQMLLPNGCQPLQLEPGQSIQSATLPYIRDATRQDEAEVGESEVAWSLYQRYFGHQ